jgi:hypothetical protein
MSTWNDERSAVVLFGGLFYIAGGFSVGIMGVSLSGSEIPAARSRPHAVPNLGLLFCGPNVLFVSSKPIEPFNSTDLGFAREPLASSALCTARRLPMQAQFRGNFLGPSHVFHVFRESMKHRRYGRRRPFGLWTRQGRGGDIFSPPEDTGRITTVLLGLHWYPPH